MQGGHGARGPWGKGGMGQGGHGTRGPWGISYASSTQPFVKFEVLLSLVATDVDPSV